MFQSVILFVVNIFGVMSKYLSFILQNINTYVTIFLDPCTFNPAKALCLCLSLFKYRYFCVAFYERKGVANLYVTLIKAFIGMLSISEPNQSTSTSESAW